MAAYIETILLGGFRGKFAARGEIPMDILSVEEMEIAARDSSIGEDSGLRWEWDFKCFEDYFTYLMQKDEGKPDQNIPPEMTSLRELYLQEFVTIWDNGATKIIAALRAKGDPASDEDQARIDELTERGNTYKAMLTGNAFDSAPDPVRIKVEKKRMDRRRRSQEDQRSRERSRIKAEARRRRTRDPSPDEKQPEVASPASS